MAIILSGGGDPAAVVAIDRYFASSIDLGKPVLYIPIAMEPDVYSYEECYAWFRRTYTAYGIAHVELCTDLSSVHLDSRYSAVFVGGGNTFKLLHEIRQSNFAEQLRAYLKAGGVLYGGSAGAIICGRTIETALCADCNRVGIEDFSGLDLLDGWDVLCHYDPSVHDSFIAELHRKLYLLHEESGLATEGSKISAVGKPFVRRDSVSGSDDIVPLL